MSVVYVDFQGRRCPVGSKVWVRGGGAAEVVACRGRERTVRVNERTPAGWSVRLMDVDVGELRDLVAYTGPAG